MPIRTGFIADSHTYYLDGEEVPSVTGIDKILATKELDRWFQERIAVEAARTGRASQGLAILEDHSAADRGTAVHTLIEDFIRSGERPPSGPHDGYFAAFEKFVQMVKPTWLETEVQVYSREHRYAGTLDFLAQTPDFGMVIGDWKTSKRPYQSMARQLSAYKHAEFFIRENDGEELKLPHVDTLLVVLLGVNGRPSVYQILNDEKHFTDFTYLRSLYTSVRLLNEEKHWAGRISSLVPGDSTWYCPPLGDDATREDLLVSSAELTKDLTEHFPRQVIGTLNKGGVRLDYVPIAEVITRLNKALGVGSWGSQVVSVGRDPIDPDWVVAHVRLTVNVGGSFAAFDQFGGQRINRTKAGGIVDLGDDFKGAVSDGIKKCAQQLGVGLELARKEEALRYEARQEAEAAKAPGAPDAVKKLRESIDSLPPSAKESFRGWWKDKKLPKPELVPATQLPELQGYVDEILEKIAKHEAEKKIKHSDAASPSPEVTPDPVPVEDLTEQEAVALVTQAIPGAEVIADGGPF